MRFDKFMPIDELKPYIKYFVVSENELETEYKIFPSFGLVVGFQYKGQLSTLKNGRTIKLSSAGITGISDSYKTFKNSADIGTVLVFFTEIGFTHFSSHPTYELFSQSISLDCIFDKNNITEVEEQLALGCTDKQRIRIIEKLMLSQLKGIHRDKLIVEAINIIYKSKGTMRMKALIEKLFISQSSFEKRFRKVVGSTLKKFASIVRFNSTLDDISRNKTLTDICYENNFFDEPHFIKDFKQFTGDTPENYNRTLKKRIFYNHRGLS